MRIPSWLMGVCLIASLATLSGAHASGSRGTGLGRSGVSAKYDRGVLMVAHTRDHGATRRAPLGRQPMALPPGPARGDARPGGRPAPALAYGRPIVGAGLIPALQARAPPPPSV